MLLSENIFSLLELDSIGSDKFRNRYNKSNFFGVIFGGQLVSQALAAAFSTSKTDFRIHSLHAYFLKSGKSDRPVDYQVERMKDGTRVSHRSVTAIQDDITIFTMNCSFIKELPGFTHQRAAADNHGLENAIALDVIELSENSPIRQYVANFGADCDVQIRVPGSEGFSKTRPQARRDYWIRIKNREGVADPQVHSQVFAYLSDTLFPGVVLTPHTIALPGPHVSVSSLDHSIWFHRELRCDDWLYVESAAPSAHGGLGLALAHVYDCTGQIVATIAQESLYSRQ